MPLLRIAMLVDVEALNPKLSTPAMPRWRVAGREASMFGSLTASGHEVSVLPFNASAARTADHLTGLKPQLVFNLTQHRQGDRQKAHEIAALLDVLDLPYTGSGPMGILRACDKALSKDLVQLAGCAVPAFVSVPVGELPVDGSVKFPAIVKPRFEGGSLGITARSVVHDIRALSGAVTRIHETLRQPAVCENFIPGREISIGLIGNNDIFAFPVRERMFPRLAKGGPQFATHRVKNDAAYRRQWNVHWQRAVLPRRVAQVFQERARSIYRELMLRDYARLDFRLSPAGELFFLQADHSPDCGPDSFGMFAGWCSVSFDQLLNSIVACCLERRRREGRLGGPASSALDGIMQRLGGARKLVQ